MLLSSCATYYEKSIRFQEYVGRGELDKASEVLNKSKKAATGKDAILYYMNSGWLNWMQGNHEQSNRDFAEADRLIEDRQKNYALEALTLISNPSIKPYAPEDFEKVLVNYFKALNYLKLEQYDEALVECRKINLKLNQLNDTYKDKKNRYSSDAFAHLIMGLVYDSRGDYNNAFIAYRNAYETYQNIYRENFLTPVPLQLKKDLIRTAYQTGFSEEARRYEDELGIKYEPDKGAQGDLVFIWQNGFGPVKSEWSINFASSAGEAGWVVLANDEYGLSFPFFIGDRPKDEQDAFGNLSLVRVAFPKYLERKPVFSKATLSAGGTSCGLELAEDVTEIGFKTLHDRMLRELANSLLRLATKKALELSAREEDKDLGAAIGILNALTEKADTRNWQTLPHSIYYARLKLPEGEQEVRLTKEGQAAAPDEKFSFTIRKGKTVFHYFQSLESYPPASR